MTRAETFFFDAHGALWATCDGGHPGAVAFGPSGIAREVGIDECRELGVFPDGETQWTAAHDAGLLRRADDDDGWDTLCLPPRHAHWRWFIGAAGAFGGSAPRMLPETPPESLEEAMQMVFAANVAARESCGTRTGDWPPVSLVVLVYGPERFAIRYGGGRTWAEYTHSPEGSSVYTGITVPDTQDLEGVEHSLEIRSREGERVSRGGAPRAPWGDR